MALISVRERFKINSDDTFVLGDGSTNNVAVYAIDIIPVSAGTISVVPVARAANIGGISTTTPGFVAIPYQSLHVNGSVGTGAFVTTAITGRSTILVPASGLSIALEVAYTSGDYEVYARPLNGPNN